jgi:N-methylhydantoinase A/oxoprolinase/acetone carboxylase beta subunit
LRVISTYGKKLSFEIRFLLRGLNFHSYEGTDTALMTLSPENDDRESWVEGFEKTYKQEFGFILEGKEIIVEDVR